ncbi:MAG: pteridine reductase [Xanthomonadales bacterium]|nr:pteridine reductase [Xanthomonadales bacterium]MCP5473624.1 pteridine reductase [Rhodanobacteraceae bacterium]
MNEADPGTCHPVALITGGAKRVGAAIARRLHTAGFDLALHYRSSAEAALALQAELASQRPGSVQIFQADLADLSATQALVPRVIAHFGRLDALINNASSFYPTPLGEIDSAQFDDLFATNARTPLFLAQAASPHLRASKGAIVNLVDIYADRPIPRYLPFCMAKAALVALTYGLARELGPEVRVNAIAPGNIIWSENPEKADTPEMVLQRTALQRQGSPEDLAGAALFLIRDAGYVTGQVLRVDGGRWLNI